ncbi:hypothetical protein LTR56_014340 [Elasticomyces elasticus]|nr:hypothetical protein LTR56_014340 [Elasticomyces elasticus]KAK3636372.1 hypothetical protein LTR22_018748 [Elasticomyces elasticus]KAK4916596.1 hypothetical protein LTR49_015429 [Elasticomyces elasticus]
MAPKNKNNVYTCPGIRRPIVYLVALSVYVFEDGSSLSESQLALVRANLSRLEPEHRFAIPPTQDRRRNTNAASSDLVTSRVVPAQAHSTGGSGNQLRAGAESAGNVRRPSQRLDQPSSQHARAQLTVSRTYRQAEAPTAEHEDAVQDSDESEDDDDSDEDGSETPPTRTVLRPDQQLSQPVARPNIHEVHTQSRDPFRHFVVGRVIEKVLSPPPTSTALSTADYAVTGARRFVIIRAPTRDDPTFEALPIKTYNGQGVAAEGVHKAHHGVIYTLPLRENAPNATDDEQQQRGELPMQAQPILVTGHDPRRPLDPMSRLDYFDRTRFPVTVPNIRLYGMVDNSSLRSLTYQYLSVCGSVQRNTGRPPPVTEHGSGTRIVAPATLVPTSRRNDAVPSRAAGLSSTQQSRPVITSERPSRSAAAQSSGRASTTSGSESARIATGPTGNDAASTRSGRQEQRGRDASHPPYRTATQLESTREESSNTRESTGRSPPVRVRQMAPTAEPRSSSRREAMEQTGRSTSRAPTASTAARSSAHPPENARSEARGDMGPPYPSRQWNAPAASAPTTKQVTQGSDDTRRIASAPATKQVTRGSDDIRRIEGNPSSIVPTRSERPTRRETETALPTQTDERAQSSNGRLTLDQMEAALDDLARRANESGFEPPRRLNETQVITLARDPQARADFFGRYRTAWEQELARRPRRS